MKFLELDYYTLRDDFSETIPDINNVFAITVRLEDHKKGIVLFQTDLFRIWQDKNLFIVKMIYKDGLDKDHSNFIEMEEDDDISSIIKECIHGYLSFLEQIEDNDSILKFEIIYYD